ncbi:TonB family protein [Sphingomonas sp. HF-S3]|uniref:TonB family protein n=1 Tax=Sphingomonas rustica TaxID=3103142 RepID=A0ABV0B632_9SPHN
MTTGGFKPHISSRIAGFLLSGAVHLAAGLALLYASLQGASPQGAAGDDRGRAMIVELIPLDQPPRTKGTDQAERQGASPTPRARPQPPLRQIAQPVLAGSIGTGPSGSPPAASEAAPGDMRQLSDLPSSELTAYRQRLETHLARYRIFPAAARAAGREGVVTVHFRMTREGRVRDAWVEASSAFGDLDAEALAAILRAQPLPMLPQGWPAEIDVSLPVTFRLG